MAKFEFFTLITLQSSEGKQDICLQLLKDAFDDPSFVEGNYFRSEEDPEILLGIHKWASFGVFQEYMTKMHEHELFKNNQKNFEFIQITHWKPL